jgi:Protein of unknown function (DUF3105)
MSTGPKPKGPQPKGPQKKSGGVKVPSTGSGGGTSTRRTLIAMGIAGLIVVAAALGYALLGSGGGSSSDAIKQLEDAGCTVQKVAALPSGDHSVLTPGGTSKKWNTDPPTSGPHYQVPAIWGAYTEPLFPAQVVHNLEHGGIFMQYGKDVPAATVAQLKAFYDNHLNATLLAPLPKLGDKIAMGVWTTSSPTSSNSGTAYLAKCTSFDEAAFAAFFKAYQFKGPERFPANTLTPGT